MKTFERKISRMKAGLRQIDAANALGLNITNIAQMENSGYYVPEKYQQLYDEYLEKINQENCPEGSK